MLPMALPAGNILVQVLSDLFEFLMFLIGALCLVAWCYAHAAVSRSDRDSVSVPSENL